MISPYLDGATLTFSANGVVRDVSRDKYAYFRFYQNQEMGEKIYEEIYLLIEEQL